MSDFTKFEPLPNIGNVVSNSVTAFNQGYNLYQCINYLQGYVSIVYENMDALLDDWNNFQQVVNENITNIATEETQKVLNQWLEDGTLNDLIAQNPLWNQKLDKSGGTMTGNIKFSENTKIVGTTPGGNDIDLIHNTNDGASGNYVQFGDPDAKTVINSSKQPVWHNGHDDCLLLTQKQLDDGLAGKVNKSGDTMTGDLGITRIMYNNVSVISPSNTNTILGSDTRQTTINSSSRPLFNYNGSNKTPVIKEDIVNNVTSQDIYLPLSAKQGNVLNDRINTNQDKINALLSKINTIQFTELIANNDDTWKDFSINIDDYDAYLLICTQSNYVGMVGSTLVPRHSIGLNNEICAFNPVELENYQVKMKFTTKSNMQVCTKSIYDGCIVYGLKLG